MSYQTQEQVLHDRINLSKLVKKLDKAIQETDWSEENNQSLWIQCQSMLQVRVSVFCSLLETALSWRVIIAPMSSDNIGLQKVISSTTYLPGCGLAQ